MISAYLFWKHCVESPEVRALHSAHDAAATGISLKEPIMYFRRLLPDDAPHLDAFLRDHQESSMFLLHNLRHGGLQFQAARHQAEYFGVVIQGRLVGVVAHTWLNTLLVQAPDADVLECFVKHLPRVLSRPVKGVLGPPVQCVELMDGLRLDRSAAFLDQDEPIYKLELPRLKRLNLPAELRMLQPDASHMPVLSAWRLAYLRDVLRFRPADVLISRAEQDVWTAVEENRAFVLERNGLPVAWCSFNALSADAVQLAGLWTPPEHRGQTFGKLAAMSALRYAHEVLGYKTATVLLDEGNRAALACCETLGFERVGRFSFTLWS